MRKNRRDNELFIGREFLNLEGRQIKHPSLIQHYANLNVNKTRDDMIELVGLDIETDPDTGMIRLLGLYEGNADDYEGDYRGYDIYEHDIFLMFIAELKHIIKSRKHIANWTKFDPTHILKMFILFDYNEEREKQALKRFGKVGGEYEDGEWIVNPVISVETDEYEIGIKQAIRSSLQFYLITKEDGRLRTCWSYDINGFYKGNLEDEGDYNKIQPNGSRGRFKWYSKLDKSAHVVDWERYQEDNDYRILVRKSNELDARVAMALGYERLKDFKTAFGYYPTSLISAGSLARSSITAMIRNKYIDLGLDKKDVDLNVTNDLKKLSIITHLDKWLKIYPEPVVKDFYIMMSEAYSGGYIDAIRYGYAPIGFYADLASAYPAVIDDLWDLTDSEVINGTGTPPEIPYSYILIRGLVTIPENVDFHSITIKHPQEHQSNIRPVGTFYATYTKEERDYTETLGATFEKEEWKGVVTKGKLSPLADIITALGLQRDHFRAVGDTAESVVKDTMNSCYGIEFEATNLHEEIDGEPERVGYRAGEFWNPLYALIVTSRTRLKLASASNEIEKNGGKVILLMTDSILWTGKAENLPINIKLPFETFGVREPKTLGHFETPELVTDICCLGSGRYGFTESKKGKEKKTVKRRGINVVDFAENDIIPKEAKFEWLNVLKIMAHDKTNTTKITVRKLISVGMLVGSLDYTIYDLGRIIEEDGYNLDIVAGRTKREFNFDADNPEILLNGLVKTNSLYLDYNVYVRDDYFDGTLPILRGKVKDKIMQTAKKIAQKCSKKRSKKYYEKNKEKIAKKRAEKYKTARDSGETREDAILLSNRKKYFK